jgi:hypothetical protein
MLKPSTETCTLLRDLKTEIGSRILLRPRFQAHRARNEALEDVCSIIDSYLEGKSRGALRSAESAEGSGVSTTGASRTERQRERDLLEEFKQLIAPTTLADHVKALREAGVSGARLNRLTAADSGLRLAGEKFPGGSGSQPAAPSADSSGTERTTNETSQDSPTRVLQKDMHRLTERVDRLSNWYHELHEAVLNLQRLWSLRSAEAGGKGTRPDTGASRDASGPEFLFLSNGDRVPNPTYKDPRLYGGSGNQPAAPFPDSSGTEHQPKDWKRDKEEV